MIHIARSWFSLTLVSVAAGLGLLGACSHGGAGDGKPPGSADLAGSSVRDFAMPLDLVGADLAGPDLASRDLAAPADLRMVAADLAGRAPCMRGVGWTAFRFHYAGSTSASIDTIGLPDRSNFQAVPGFATVFDDALHGGGINIASLNFILIRFSLDGLTLINSATLSIYGRSYNTGSSGSFRAWSPIYSDLNSATDSVSNAWPYDWTSIDYTAHVRIGDPKGTTAIRLYAGLSSNDLIINTVELCIDGG